jgi:hypothetical protein
MRLDGGCGFAGSSAMGGIWRAAKNGDFAEVERLLGQDPGLLNAKEEEVHPSRTPLMGASARGHVGVVRWLLDQGAALNEQGANGCTALALACSEGRTPVVKLLLEEGADPTIVMIAGSTPLIAASDHGHLEVVRLLLAHPGGKATINNFDRDGETALWRACFFGHGAIVRGLLESGADPTIADNDGTTPMAIAKQPVGVPTDRSAEGRRECVAALEVRLFFPQSCRHLLRPAGMLSWTGRRRSGPTCSGRPGRWPTSRGAARWRWRGRKRKEAKEVLVDFTIHGLKGDLFLDLMEYMG